MKITLISILVIAFACSSEGLVKSYKEVIGGSPWHVAIYEKYGDFVSYHCSGTILTKKIVITIAECVADIFTGDPEEVQYYRIAAGKILRDWIEEPETVQKKKVIEIVKQKGFLGLETKFVDDVALLIIDSPFEFNDNVKPINLDFSIFEDGRIKKDAIGKVVGWGTKPLREDPEAAFLKALELPIADKELCRKQLPSVDSYYLVDDKICCGFINETTDCISEKGSGLVFPYEKDGKTEYYLRGLFRRNINFFKKINCESSGVFVITDIIYHRKFIEDMKVNANK